MYIRTYVRKCALRIRYMYTYTYVRYVHAYTYTYMYVQGAVYGSVEMDIRQGTVAIWRRTRSMTKIELYKSGGRAECAVLGTVSRSCRPYCSQENAENEQRITNSTNIGQASLKHEPRGLYFRFPAGSPLSDIIKEHGTHGLGKIKQMYVAGKDVCSSRKQRFFVLTTSIRPGKRQFVLPTTGIHPDNDVYSHRKQH